MLECLDNKGYLSESVESVAAYFHTDEQRIEALLKLLQELDPAGVCARNLEECLRLQLTRRQLDTPVLLSLVDTCLELVAKNQIPAIGRKLRLTRRRGRRLLPDHQILKPKTRRLLLQPGPAALHHPGRDHCEIQGPLRHPVKRIHVSGHRHQQLLPADEPESGIPGGP